MTHSLKSTVLHCIQSDLSKVQIWSFLSLLKSLKSFPRTPIKHPDKAAHPLAPGSADLTALLLTPACSGHCGKGAFSGVTGLGENPRLDVPRNLSPAGLATCHASASLKFSLTLLSFSTRL